MDIVSRIHGFKRFNKEVGLDRMKCLLKLLGNPEEGQKYIHVAGTNGKGSTCRYMYEMLRAQGYKVGIYTSPYLEVFNERIEFDGKYITNEELEKYFEIVQVKCNEVPLYGHDMPSEFEVITAIAFLYYKDKNCDYIILETGLGGRYDATNVIKEPLISVICSISYDHMDVLGDTLEKIAYEKAGIIKEGCPVVCSAKDDGVINVIKNVAFDLFSPSYFTRDVEYRVRKRTIDGYCFDAFIFNIDYRNINISMVGSHQIENAILALSALTILKFNKVLEISNQAIGKGLRKAIQIGRFEVISSEPLMIIDGAHNSDAARLLRETVNALFPKKRILIVLGMLKDKDIEGVIEEIAPLSNTFIVSRVLDKRSANPKDIADILESEKYDKMTYTCESPEMAALIAKEIGTNYDVTIFCGSIYFIGEVKGYFK